MRVAIFVLTVATTLCFGCDRAEEGLWPADQRFDEDASTPFAVELTWLDGPKRSGPQNVSVRVTPKERIRNLRASLRGVDGLGVKAQGQAVELITGDESLDIRALLTLPKEHRSTLAVDLAWGRGGLARSATLALIVGNPLLPYPNEQLGEVKRDHNGNPIEVLPAEMR